MKIAMLAINQWGVIGVDNKLPWKPIPSDMEYFRTITAGQVVVMGRKTFESIPEKYRPLLNRTNIVLTRDRSWSHEGVDVYHDFNPTILAKMEEEYPGKDIVIIGGADLYHQVFSWKVLDALSITRVMCYDDFSGEPVHLTTRAEEKRLGLRCRYDLCTSPYHCFVEIYGAII